MAKKNRISPVVLPDAGFVDCACVIHGDAYSWTYVERLYNMLCRSLSKPIRFHVYTEPSRPVPQPWIKHELIEWKVAGPKKSWWYKLQLFNSDYHQGPLLYFDLDVVIAKNIDWIVNLPTNYFWGVRDFKYLWRPTWYGINSSVMWWDTRLHDSLWKDFEKSDIYQVFKDYHGDQDYITAHLAESKRKCFDTNRIKSWRWELLDGGYNFMQRVHHLPGAGTQIPDAVGVLVFHGKPKPHDITDSKIQKLWQ